MEQIEEARRLWLASVSESVWNCNRAEILGSVFKGPGDLNKHHPLNDVM